MQNSFDMMTLVFLALAVFVAWKLRSVLGQKTGSEKPPADPFSRRETPPVRPDQGAPAESRRDNVAKEVYEGFEQAITDREKRGEKSESSFVSIDKAEMTAVDVKGKTGQVTIAFVSQLISVTRDAQGVVVDGSAEAVSEVNDIWTFSRQLGSRDPNWLLVATESAA